MRCESARRREDQIVKDYEQNLRKGVARPLVPPKGHELTAKKAKLRSLGCWKSGEVDWRLARAD